MKTLRQHPAYLKATMSMYESIYSRTTEISIIKVHFINFNTRYDEYMQSPTSPVPIAVTNEVKQVTRLLIIAITTLERFIPNTAKEID